MNQTEKSSVLMKEGRIRIFITPQESGVTVSMLHAVSDKPVPPTFTEKTEDLALEKCHNWIMENFTPPFIFQK